MSHLGHGDDSSVDHDRGCVDKTVASYVEARVADHQASKDEESVEEKGFGVALRLILKASRLITLFEGLLDTLRLLNICLLGLQPGTHLFLFTQNTLLLLRSFILAIARYIVLGGDPAPEPQGLNRRIYPVCSPGIEDLNGQRVEGGGGERGLREGVPFVTESPATYQAKIPYSCFDNKYGPAYFAILNSSSQALNLSSIRLFKHKRAQKSEVCRAILILEAPTGDFSMDTHMRSRSDSPADGRPPREVHRPNAEI